MTPLITIFVRHAAECKYAGDEFSKRCNCRKHFRWTQDGVQVRKKAGTRSWAEAEEEKRRLEDQLAGRVPTVETKAVTIRGAIETFIREKEVAGVSAKCIKYQYTPELRRLAEFMEGKRVFTVAGITPVLLTEFKGTWKRYSSTYTRAIVQKRLIAFFNFCVSVDYIAKVPALSPVKIDEPPTMPLTEVEYRKILETVAYVFPNGVGKRVRAIIQLMRWSGLAVRDASCIKRESLVREKDFYSIVTQRQKTGIDVRVPIPIEIGDEVLVAAKGTSHLFWTPESCLETSFAARHSAFISRVFTGAGVEGEGGMVSHRLRDTFAVELLQKGVPLEEVSKLLGHSSIVTTEKHYAKWVKGRQDRLDSLVTATWAKK